MQTFNDITIPQALFHRIEQIGFVTPTPIQAQAIPVALEGSDILGSAQTGTGKTAAYGIPLIAHLLNNNHGTSLVLLPTRELAVQVMSALKQFIGRSKLSTALLIGGEEMRKQFRQLQAKPRLVVGTPGRVNDHLNRKSLQLNNTNFLVLDEVDRMLDMGFGIQLEAISQYLTAKRQTLMFSATLPPNINKVADKYLDNPIRISVGEMHVPAPKVKQTHVKVADADKYTRLLDEIQERSGSIIVFVKTKRAADAMSVKLRKLGHEADALHGDLRQSKRSRVIANFHKQKFRILIATDVAARGLDVPHIEHVINYDLPQCPEDYIHRIGRTARAGAEGEAINFLSSSDTIKWRAIQLLLDPNAKPDNIGRSHKNKNRNNNGHKRPGKKPFKAFKGPRTQKNKDGDKPRKSWKKRDKAAA